MNIFFDENLLGEKKANYGNNQILTSVSDPGEGMGVVRRSSKNHMIKLQRLNK